MILSSSDHYYYDVALGTGVHNFTLCAPDWKHVQEGDCIRICWEEHYNYNAYNNIGALGKV